jgi:hypothetical protein
MVTKPSNCSMTSSPSIAAYMNFAMQVGHRHSEFPGHPLLVPWEQLSEEEREKDRDTIRELPGIVELAGFRVQRPYGIVSADARWRPDRAGPREYLAVTGVTVYAHEARARQGGRDGARAGACGLERETRVACRQGGQVHRAGDAGDDQRPTQTPSTCFVGSLVEHTVAAARARVVGAGTI